MTKWLFLAASAAITAAACTSLTATPAEAKGEAKPSASGTKEFQRISITELYNQQCLNCHGDKGQGGGGGTKSLLTKDKFDQKWDKPFFDAIKDGVAHMGMEPFGQSLSEEQMWGLVVNIREKQGRALRAEFGGPKEVNGVYTSQHHPYTIETVVEEGKGLRTPWALDWLPDGRMLVTNRPGGILVFKGGENVGSISGLPEATEIGQGGQMEVAVHPNYSKNGWIYLSYTESSQAEKRRGMTKIVRGKLAESGSEIKWVGQQTIWETSQDNYTGAGVHFGSKIVFDGKGHIYFSVGERGTNMGAQDLTKPFGKNYRVKEDGSIPSDNPFVSAEDKAKGVIPSIWSYGHRNQQGLTIDLEGGVWNTEHGPRGGDEVNYVKKGANYGWPRFIYSINYNDQPIGTPWAKPEDKITQPVFRWLPSIGASGLDVIDGKAFPKWKGDLVAGGLAGNNVDRFRMKNGNLVEREELVWGKGRVRDVKTAPDGTIYLALNQPDKIVRIVPAK